jgi:hypothetical protein
MAGLARLISLSFPRKREPMITGLWNMGPAAGLRIGPHYEGFIARLGDGESE